MVDGRLHNASVDELEVANAHLTIRVYLQANICAQHGRLSSRLWSVEWGRRAPERCELNWQVVAI